MNTTVYFLTNVTKKSECKGATQEIPFIVSSIKRTFQFQIRICKVAHTLLEQLWYLLLV